MPIGIREFRADLATHVRRAAGGEPTVVSVGGRPVAALVPLSAMDVGTATSDVGTAASDVDAAASDVDAAASGVDAAGHGRAGAVRPEEGRERSALIVAGLVASGALVPPRRTDARVPGRQVAVWGNVRLDRLLREIRG